jgi:hypothetical protein
MLAAHSACRSHDQEWGELYFQILPCCDDMPKDNIVPSHFIYVCVGCGGGGLR